jgi:hypothetical protein
VLEHEDLKAILDKENLDVDDIERLNRYVFYIADLKEQFDETMPEDVFFALYKDLNDIIDRLQVEYKKIRIKKMRLL